MKHYYPAYYQEFRCIAADCPDSCCQGWDVVIDEVTEAYYQTVQGALGDRLRSALYTDADGDRVFRLAENKKCPFWGSDRLCDIYKTLGEERLCATCALFPRIRMVYAGFTEHTLALACPEAARLILTTDGAYMMFTHTAAASCEDYSEEEITLLLRSRQKAAAILINGDPLPRQFERLMLLAEETQAALTGHTAESGAMSAAELFDTLEYIDENNRGRFTRAAAVTPDFQKEEAAYRRLALYWLYRYWLGAVDTLDVLAPARFLILSVNTVAALAEDIGDIVKAAQTYSKEVEQSYENMEKLLKN